MRAKSAIYAIAVLFITTQAVMADTTSIDEIKKSNAHSHQRVKFSTRLKDGKYSEAENELKKWEQPYPDDKQEIGNMRALLAGAIKEDPPTEKEKKALDQLIELSNRLLRFNDRMAPAVEKLEAALSDPRISATTSNGLILETIKKDDVEELKKLLHKGITQTRIII